MEKQKAFSLIREFFGATLQELKGLTALDRNQLASTIARQKGIAPADCEFEFVAY